MTKPRGIQWLEEQTGETLDPPGGPIPEGKHLSVRLTGDLVSQLEEHAAARGESISQVARRLIKDGLDRATNPDRDAIDQAIAVLEAVKARPRGRRAG
ncbi:MAG: ribbon-helix-helix protein, CopG family [Actinobacteria bacterium]|nr:ribbon-helix-helix protein, CopG family [Actinomycetota bacterium]